MLISTGSVLGVLIAAVLLSAVAVVVAFLLWRKKTRTGVLDIKGEL